MASKSSLNDGRAFDFASWPPKLSPEQLNELVSTASAYSLAHGLLYLPPGYPLDSPPPQAAIHAPLSLVPSPFPRDLFESAKRLQTIYNVLYSRIAMNIPFLDEVMGAEQGVGRVDDFIGELWRGWKRLRDEGKLPQPLHLGLFRSDYLLHIPGDQKPSLKQVEFNTISISFGCLAQRVAELHRYQLAATSYFDSSPYLQRDNFPPNESISGLAEGLATAHKAYVSQGGNPRSKILFVIQPGERNVFDQKWLEFELLEKHSIHVLRQTFDDLITSAKVENETLTVSSTTEISVVYYRSGYMPHEYPTPAHYTVRLILESSKAINCPTIALQLAGGKKVQEVLTRPGVVEKFLPEFSAEQIAELRGSFMDMWGLDEDSQDAVGSTETGGQGKSEPLGTTKARKEFASLVLKPQREGGGNNVYKDDIPAFLDKLPPEEREAWIAMRLIEVPQGVRGWLLRAGSVGYSSDTLSAHNAVEAEVVSELGIFGWALFGKDGEKEKIEEKEVGWLVRTKGKDSNEGGVATGFSVLDSLVLV
ncbi:glutathione synthase [Coprinopsis cinerea okayama7|uniref:Glutathione synthetase n=1 Tax=Coprinopsis cinerea (strain Okayama-7 / 130 / ATCC MYA-4618 / FGSC 9003) TaxID=240176 RepID=A8NSF5_COPC7|nr:glutathione synthase [Coprinopsis cinerea okayama7\|eukprot:XP_001836000.2 glutathione synthase [Coprinopsis cinerea okayama7\